MTDETAEGLAHEPSEITYSEQFYPARPQSLRPRARLRPQGAPAPLELTGEAVGTNPFYVAWLEKSSMLHDANTISRQFSGSGSMWQNPYANPDPRRAVEAADVWFTAYPLSFVTRAGRSFLAELADPDLWQAFATIGINAVHTGPVKRAGGLNGWQPTPSVDGHFDRVSTEIDNAFGTEEEFRRVCEVAAAHGGTIIDDIVPGHTGKGPDFRLAEMGVGDYPGIYHMVEIPPEDWGLLPDVPPGRDSKNLDGATEKKLMDAGYIVGELQRVIFHSPGVKDTNWSTTAPVAGPDGVERRWVYLHYFKEGQPSINWLDPTFAGMRLVIGDALHSLGDLGTGGLRLDANGFLGVERSTEGLPAWSEGHPLSEAANHLIASMVRKVGGFTFQELNLTIDDIRDTAETGADLSYDFINRPAYHHALLTQDTEFLRLTLNASLEYGLQPVQLVHALQNHDELTYELVHFATRHSEDRYNFRGQDMAGWELAEQVRQDLLETMTGPAAPYNAVFTTNGIASTTGSVITAALGISDLAHAEDRRAEIQRAHLLLAKFNAWQPGVFALSGWDLCGVLPLPADLIEPLLATGDTRWLHRGGYDLLDHGADGFNGMPLGQTLYGPLPEQLEDPTSFAVALRKVLDVRRASGVRTATQVDVPAVAHPGMLVMVHALDQGGLQVTALNFSQQPVSGTVRSEALPAGATVVDLESDSVLCEVDELQSFNLHLAALEGRCMVVSAPTEVE